ncbi:unnamed protein product [Coccothraustes coccothraustes]
MAHASARDRHQLLLGNGWQLLQCRFVEGSGNGSTGSLPSPRTAAEARSCGAELRFNAARLGSALQREGSRSDRRDALLFSKENARFQAFKFLGNFCITWWEGLGSPAPAQSGIT